MQLIFDLGGRFEATISSGAAKMTCTSIMHIDTRVIEVAEFKSEVIFDLQGH